MAPRRWSTDHVVAIVEAVCGIAAAGYLVVIGVTAELQGTAGHTALDRAFPFLAAAVVLALLGHWAIRSWRTAERRSAPHTGTRRDHPRAETAPSGPRPGQPPVHRPTSTLSESGREAMATIVTILADARIFAPRVPDPRDLEPAVADHGEPVTVAAVLGALHETDYWRPGFRFEDHTSLLAFHDSHVEQDAGSLRAGIHDLDRLAGDGIRVTAGDIDVEWVDGVRAARDLVLDFAGVAKQLSTVIPVAVARALRTAGAPGRLAWLWSDQGVWITALPTGFDLGRLNTDLVDLIEAGEVWEWVDNQEPFAAGEER